MYLSQPLHFGDYAGLPLKLIWGIFDLIAIILLVSGLYLWLGRRGTSLRLRVREVSCGGAMEMPGHAVCRSEERREGKACVSTGGYRGWACHKKKKKKGNI